MRRSLHAVLKTQTIFGFALLVAMILVAPSAQAQQTARERRIAELQRSVQQLRRQLNEASAETQAAPRTTAPASLADEYQSRRAAVMESMEPGSVLILRGVQGGGDGLVNSFRQGNNFHYLTGITDPGGVLVLSKTGRAVVRGRGGARGRRGGRAGNGFTLYANSRNSEGLRELGLDNVRPQQDFRGELERILMGRASTIYMDYERTRSLSDPLTADDALFKAARDRGASFEIKSPVSLINPLRRVKSAHEIELLKTAIDITNEAHREVMRSAKPGMYEYQIQALLEYVFALNRAKWPGFKTIVGSGPNSCEIHWQDNTRKTQPGDVVVVDIGAEYDMYTADVTRTIPISGKFSDRQREIYEIVLEANQECIKMVRPGVNWRDISAKADEILMEGLLRVGLIKEKTRSELRRYYFHGLGHNIGLQVHDVGGLGVLEADMVLTIEPGLYIREEGIGFRIEDCILVTEDGYVELTAGAPKTVEDIENMMRQSGGTDVLKNAIKK